MAELTEEQKAFLHQRIPENYLPVREPVVYIRDLLAIKKLIVAAPDPESSNLELVGLTAPARGLPVAELQNIVRHACKALDYDRENSQAYVLLVRGVIELARYDDMIVHPFPLREVLPLAQRGKSIDETLAEPWAAYIEVNIYLKRWDTVTENLANFRTRKFDARLSAELSLLAAKGQELPADEVLWYDRLLAMTQLSAERAELHGKQGMSYLKLKLKKEADLCFHRALAEGGPLSWVAHQWSMLKDDMGVRPAAIELNRRAIIFDGDNRAAKAYAEHLRAPFRRFGHPFPGPAALEEEKIRGVALPGCDEAVLKATKLKPYEPPKSVTRAIARRDATRMLSKGKAGPASIATGEGAISLARNLTPDEPTEAVDESVGAGYLEQSGDAAAMRLADAERKKKEKKDDSGLLVPRDADVPLPRPATRTIRNDSVITKTSTGAPSPQTRIVRRPPPVPLGIAAPTPGAAEPAASDSNPEQEAPPKPKYVRPPTGQAPALRPPTGQAPALKPPTGQAPALKPPTGQAPALKPPTGQAPALPPRPEAPTRIIRPPSGPAPVPPNPVSSPAPEPPPEAESLPALEPASDPKKAAFRPEPPPSEPEPTEG